MEVTREMVEKIADLAKLSFSDEEMEEIRLDLAQMIGFVDQLKALDLDGVPPLTHMTDAVNAWREDRAIPGLPCEEALSNAPSVEGPFMTVPKFIQKP
ncbi:MAG: Asp-tRNA(Asn)/Glu-tRNA(Gln) amidotransferase subunit GatC [Chitinophagia bacterium]|nr:Asp-tRNA(Asn)/Glu-tRNA(Gln) amidotransferase subunit GatC [Chitinophagia bacterium]